MQQRVDELLNDGVLVYGERKTIRDRNGKKTGVDFLEAGHLFFNYQTVNYKFDQYIVGHLGVVDLKVKCFYTNTITQSHLVRIDQQDYEILNMDPDNKRKYIYLFLRKVVA